MNALIYMQPLDVRRRPMYPAQFVGTVPRDGIPHCISGSFELDPQREMPYFVHVFADGEPRKGMIREVQASPPDRFKRLSSVSYYIDGLTVMPRAQ